MRQRTSTRKGYKFRPRLEDLEDRTLLSTFSVVNTNDDGLGSLRQAILDANSHGNFLNPGGAADIIAFNIPADDPGHFYYRNDGLNRNPAEGGKAHLTVAGINTTSAAADATIADIDPDWQHSWFTIVPASSLPAPSETVVLDGYSQPGASPNTNGPGLGDNAVLRIDLDGTSWQSGRIGLTMTTPNITVQGLAINHFNFGIDLTGASATGNRVQGDFIGTDVSGLVALPNAFGIALDASNNTVGGTAPAARNVISGNINSGIELGVSTSLPVAHDNLIEGNFIGTDASGAAALGNESDGILISQNSGNRVGGTTADARNVISGNRLSGVAVGSGNDVASDNVIEGNYIGTDVTGTMAVPNGYEGVFDQSSPNTTIGGDGPGAGNLISGNLGNGVTMNFAGNAGNVIQGNRIGTAADGISPLGNGGNGILVGTNIAIHDNAIAFNGAAGVACVAGTGDAVLGNSMFGNVGRGIAFGGLFVANDQGDADTGVNNLQNFPEISSSALSSSGMLTITYGVPSDAANSTYPIRVEFFKADAGGQQGQTFLGSDTFTTADLEAGGKTVSFVPAAAIVLADKLVATATDAGNNTSEFSTSIQVSAAASSPDLSVTISGDPSPVDAGQNVTYTIVVKNNDVLATTGFTLTTAVPEHNTFVSFTAFAGGTSTTPPVGDTGDIVSTKSSLASGASARFTLVVQVLAQTAAGTAIMNSASVAGSEADPDLHNNVASTTTMVQSSSADLAVQVNLDQSIEAERVLEQFGFRSYVVQVSNYGPGMASNVVVRITVPEGSAIPKGIGFLGALDAVQNPFVPELGLGNIPSGQSESVYFVFLPVGLSTVMATVSANEADPNPENNSAAVREQTVNLPRPGALQFSAGAYSVNEGGGQAVITVTRAGGSDGAVSVDFNTSDGTAVAGSLLANRRGGGDYQKTSGTITFNDGETTKTVTIPINDDLLIENAETVRLTLSNPTGGATLGNQTTALLTIIDNDPQIAFALTKSSAIEAKSPAVLTVTLSSPLTKQASVKYAVVGGTATAGADYTLRSGQLVFAPGQTSKTISITIVNDVAFEPNETIVVGLSKPVNASLGAASVHTYTIGNDDAPPDPAGSTKSTAQGVNLTTVPRQVLANALSRKDSDMFRVFLNQGDFLAVDMDPIPNSTLKAATLILTDPSGGQRTVGASPEPDTGVVTKFPALGFRASVPGNYYLLLQTADGSAGRYTLELHRLVLAQGRQDPAALQQTGPMYAFLQGNTLSLTGPTGYGFAITGNWKQTTAHPRSQPALVTSTYAVTGSLTLQTALGPMPFDVPTGTFTVTTIANTFGTVFGAVQSIQGELEGSLDDFMRPFTAGFAKLGASISTNTPKSDWRIELGSQLRAERSIAQVLNGVPYLTTSATPSGHFQFGNASFDIPLVDKQSKNKPFFAIEPADPMLYTSFPGVKYRDNVIKDFAFAASRSGRIPFEPLHTPTVQSVDPLNQFFGHVYITDTFEFKVYLVTVSLDGAITVNLDANGDGQLLGGSGNASQLFHGDLAALGPVLGDVDVGANGVIALGGWQAALANIFKVDVQLGDVTTVFDGPRAGLWVSGTSGLKDPLANTPLRDFVITNHDVFQAAVSGNGTFFVTFSTQQNLVGAKIGFTVTLDNSGFNTQITGSAGWSLDGLSAQATVTGELSITVDPYTLKLHYFGSVRATGKVTAPLPGGSTSASFDVGAEIDGNLLIFDLPLLGRQTITLP